MKYIKTLSAALLVAASTQLFAADDALTAADDALTLAATNRKDFAQRIMDRAGRDLAGADITNATLASAGMAPIKGMSVLSRVRAEFDAGKSAGAVFAAPPGHAHVCSGLHRLELGEHVVPNGHAITLEVVAGVTAGTHFIAEPVHNLTADHLAQLQAGTHHVVADAVLQTERDTKALAENRLASLQTRFDALYRDAITVIADLASDPALKSTVPARKAALMTALGFDDAEMVIPIQALAALTGGQITPKDYKNADLAAVDAAGFLHAIKNGTMNEDNTMAALRATPEYAANPAEIDAIQTFIDCIADFA